jgi:hypothetical protein
MVEMGDLLTLPPMARHQNQSSKKSSFTSKQSTMNRLHPYLSSLLLLASVRLVVEAFVPHPSLVTAQLSSFVLHQSVEPQTVVPDLASSPGATSQGEWIQQSLELQELHRGRIVGPKHVLIYDTTLRGALPF